MIGLMVGSTNLPVRANFDSQIWPEHGAECVTAATTKKGFARSGRRPANAHGADRSGPAGSPGRVWFGPFALPGRAMPEVSEATTRRRDRWPRWPPAVADHVQALPSLDPCPTRARGVRGTSSTSSASVRSRARTSSANIARWRPWPKRSSSTTHRSARCARLLAVDATLWHLEAESRDCERRADFGPGLIALLLRRLHQQ